MSHHDVVVVGVGVAGLSAAVRLAEGGARVLVLAKGIGATHLAPGTIDVLGYDPEPVERPLDAVRALADARPDHPYAAVGADAVADAVSWFRGAFADGPLAPYAYTGTAEVNLLLPTAVGVPRPSAVVPETMAAGETRDAGEVCVVGFRALKDFHPLLCADNLSRLPGVRARGIALDLLAEARVDANSQGYARAFEDPVFRAEVVAALAGRLGAEERVGFPAVLGIKDPHGVWSDLQDKLGRPVFEIPTLPPSVPGMRIFATLRERLRRAGATVRLNNIVTGAESAGGRVTALRARVGLGERRFGADWVVVATGGFADGGLELDSRWVAREVALGLPVSFLPAPGAERFGPAYFGAHPMARAGVAVDAALRPLGPSGERVHDNVLVAGATLGGAEPWREKSGHGLSLATGHRAAGLILDEVRPAAAPAGPTAATTTGG